MLFSSLNFHFKVPYPYPYHPKENIFLISEYLNNAIFEISILYVSFLNFFSWCRPGFDGHVLNEKEVEISRQKICAISRFGIKPSVRTIGI